MTIFFDGTAVNRSITFLSKNKSDATVWSGKILGICNSDLASGYNTDIAPYNEAVMQADNTVSSVLSNLNFFVIELTNSSGTQGKYAFAQEWILDGSFKFTDNMAVVTVTVYTTQTSTGDYSDVLTQLRAAGYTCEIASVVT